MIYLVIFILFNVFIGLVIVLISGDKFPYKGEKNNQNKFDDYEEIEEIETVEEEEIKEEEIHLPVNDEDKVNNLARQLIPNETDHLSPKKEAAKEMGDRVKEYFEDNPRDASKIFKTMLKKDN